MKLVCLVCRGGQGLKVTVVLVPVVVIKRKEQIESVLHPT